MAKKKQRQQDFRTLQKKYSKLSDKKKRSVQLRNLASINRRRKMVQNAAGSDG